MSDKSLRCVTLGDMRFSESRMNNTKYPPPISLRGISNSGASSYCSVTSKVQLITKSKRYWPRPDSASVQFADTIQGLNPVPSKSQILGRRNANHVRANAPDVQPGGLPHIGGTRRGGQVVAKCCSRLAGLIIPPLPFGMTPSTLI